MGQVIASIGFLLASLVLLIYGGTKPERAGFVNEGGAVAQEFHHFLSAATAERQSLPPATTGPIPIADMDFLPDTFENNGNWQAEILTNGRLFIVGMNAQAATGAIPADVANAYFDRYPQARPYMEWGISNGVNIVGGSFQTPEPLPATAAAGSLVFITRV
jgi:hypothetical protein